MKFRLHAMFKWHLNSGDKFQLTWWALKTNIHICTIQKTLENCNRLLWWKLWLLLNFRLIFWIRKISPRAQTVHQSSNIVEDYHFIIHKIWTLWVSQAIIRNNLIIHCITVKIESMAPDTKPKQQYLYTR